MQAEAYELMASHEDTHWWFVGRRAIVSRLIDLVPLGPNALVLEAGCGTGGNLHQLATRGRVCAFEPNDRAIAIARERHPLLDISSGALPHELPYPKDRYDLVLALDVLEHVEDDVASLDALVAMAAPGGYVLITVPAHQFLWGSHDRRLAHVRRYDPKALVDMCRQAGAEVFYEGPFNTVLAPIAIVVRLAERLGIGSGNQERKPYRPLNRLLGLMFASEAAIVPRVRLPFGLSHAVLMRRPA